MKYVMTALILVSSSLSFAAAKCPSSTKVVKLCASTPQKGDSVIVSGVVKSVALCNSGSETLMVVEDVQNDQDPEAPGAVSEPLAVKKQALAGSTIYSVRSQNSDGSDTMLTLSITSGVKPVKNVKNNAKLSISYIDVDQETGEEKVSSLGKSTFTCK